MSKHSIQESEIEARARAVFGDRLVRVECVARVRRSERITIYLEGKATVTLSSDSYSDPDGVRKFALQLFGEMEDTARKVAASMLAEQQS